MAGSKNSVNTVDDPRPPITTVANGRCTSDPAEVDNAIGKKPNAATSAVINTGRNRAAAPARIACSTSPVSSSNRLILLTITIPFNTATPNSAMNPIDADRFKFIPRSHNAATPPTSAKGTLAKISIACRNELNVRYSNPKISASDAGSTSSSRFVARS